MRKIVLFITLVVIGLSTGCAGNDKGNTEDMDVLSIYDIKSDPLSYTGLIKINGVASSFSEDDPTYFTVMDTNELLACKNLYCGAYAMPANYFGSDPLPELADMIDIIGSFVKTDNGYFFEVTKIEVKQNIMKRLTLSNPGGAQ